MLTSFCQNDIRHYLSVSIVKNIKNYCFSHVGSGIIKALHTNSDNETVGNNKKRFHYETKGNMIYGGFKIKKQSIIYYAVGRACCGKYPTIRECLT